jgi:iron complex outermembrane receptor protein
MGGLRADVTRFEVEDNLINATDPDDSGERTMEAISPSIGLSYEVGQPLTVYGNVSSSFETPTTTELANRPTGAGGFNPELDPQRTLSFELGAKGLLGNIATYQLAGYRAEVQDALIPFEVAGFAGRTFYRNAGSAVHQGIEAGLTIAPFEGTTANLAYTYVDARFDDYVVGSQSFKDNRVPGVAPHRVEGSLTYRAPFGWFAGIDARYSDTTPVNDRNTDTSPAYTVLDFRTGLEGLSFGGLEIAPIFGVTNVFDQEYNTAVTVNAFGTPGRFYEPGPGRSFYAGGQLRASMN